MKIIKDIRCALGIHDRRAAARSYDYFSTKFVDQGTTRNWHVYLFRCEHCGHRSFETNKPPHVNHSSIEKVKNWWIDRGYIPNEITQPREENKSVTPQPQNSMSEKVFKLVEKALSTTSENEAIQCFQKARKIHKND